MEFGWFRGQKAICFAHMQKSGGSSAFRFIYEHASRDRGWKNEHYLRIWCTEFVPKHIDGIRAGQFRFVYGHFDPTPLFEHFSGVYFTLVRDPVERVISLYNFCATMDDATLGGITGVQSPDFAHLTPAIYSLSNDMQSMIAAVRGGLSFADFIRLPPELFRGLEGWHGYLSYLPESGSPAEYARRFDVIGLSDHMGEALGRLADIMGWPAPESAPRVNVTPGRAFDRRDLRAEDIRVIEARAWFETELYEIVSQQRRT